VRGTTPVRARERFLQRARVGHGLFVGDEVKRPRTPAELVALGRQVRDRDGGLLVAQRESQGDKESGR